MIRKQEVLNDVVIKFAGDSGDGMQLTGSQFTNNTAMLGIDLATFPDFPAEIRAPQGTLPGVSGFQLRFSSNPVFTPGDLCDVLVAMNAAALKTNLKQLKKGGKIIENTDGFDYGDCTETFTTKYKVEKAKMEVGEYRSIMGNQALTLGLIAASQKSGLQLFLGSYPITPASDILHDLAKYKNFGVKTFQAE